MSLRCLVIDDEYPARVLMASYIARLPQLELLESFRRPAEALAYLQIRQVDLLFLDIQMPELSGLQFLKALRDPPLVILTTAFAHYALEGYELDVVDYLLKPFAFERLVQAVQKASERLLLREARPPEERTAPDGEPEGEFISLKADRKIHRLAYRDIHHIEGLREYVVFHCLQGKLITLESLKNLEQRLPRDQFLRVHKSFIVRTDLVQALAGNLLELRDGPPIPIGKSFKEQVLRRLFP